MLRVSEDGSRRREGFVATYRDLCASLADLQEAADRIFDTISRRVRFGRLCCFPGRFLCNRLPIDSIFFSLALTLPGISAHLMASVDYGRA